jgi:hypothetical protein
MQEAVRILVRPDDMLEKFSELAGKRQRRHTRSEIRCT